MYVEFRRRTRSGVKHLMLAFQDACDRAEQFRIYEHNVVPGLFQTPDYIRAMLRQLRPLRSATILSNGAQQTIPPAIPDQQQALLDQIAAPNLRH